MTPTPQRDGPTPQQYRHAITFNIQVILAEIRTNDAMNNDDPIARNWKARTATEQAACISWAPSARARPSNLPSPTAALKWIQARPDPAWIEIIDVLTAWEKNTNACNAASLERILDIMPGLPNPRRPRPSPPASPQAKKTMTIDAVFKMTGFPNGNRIPREIIAHLRKSDNLTISAIASRIYRPNKPSGGQRGQISKYLDQFESLGLVNHAADNWSLIVDIR